MKLNSDSMIANSLGDCSNKNEEIKLYELMLHRQESDCKERLRFFGCPLEIMPWF